MTDPTYDATEGRPPGDNEGPPEGEADMTEARRHVERIDAQNRPAGDPNALYGPGRKEVNGADNSDASDPQ